MSPLSATLYFVEPYGGRRSAADSVSPGYSYTHVKKTKQEETELNVWEGDGGKPASFSLPS